MRELQQMRQLGVVKRRDDEQHDVRPMRTRLPDLVIRGDEILPKHRDVHSGTYGIDIVKRPEEPAAFSEHRDCARTALFVLSAQSGRVFYIDEMPFRRRGTLYFGNHRNAVVTPKPSFRVEGSRSRGSPGLELFQRRYAFTVALVFECPRYQFIQNRHAPPWDAMAQRALPVIVTVTECR